MPTHPQELLSIRPGSRHDIEEINAIYNRFIVEAPVTFDVVPFTIAQRTAWFAQFAEHGPHRLRVAERDSHMVGFACSSEFRHKQAYETSVETTIYLDPEACGRGIGTRLYSDLFRSIESEDLHRAYAGITLPNAASIALHQRFDFRAIGTFDEVGRKFGRYWSVQWYEKQLA